MALIHRYEAGEGGGGAEARSLRYRNTLDGLAAKLKRGQCLIFLGAGASVEVGGPGLPTAKELSKEMARRCGLQWYDYIPLSTIAFYFESFFGRDELNELIRTAIGDQRIPPSTSIRKLIRIIRVLEDQGVQTVAITTNYDQQFERAYEEEFRRRPAVIIYKGAWDPNDRNARLNVGMDGELDSEGVLWQPSKATSLYKIHGCVSQPADLGLVITEEDYINFLANSLASSDDEKRILQHIRRRFELDTILFVGYSLSDWNFRAIFKATVEKRNKKKKSYAIQYQDQESLKTNAFERARWDSMIDFWGPKEVDILNVKAADFLDDLYEMVSAAPLAQAAGGD